MVFKGNGPLSFPLFPRLGFGSSQNPPRDAGRRENDWYIPYNGPYEAPNLLNHEKGGSQMNVATDNVLRRFVGPRDDVHTGATVTRRRARAASAHVPTPLLVIPNADGGIGESPIPLHRSVPPVPPKRSSRMGFFAFSSNRKSQHGPPIVQMPPSQQVDGSETATSNAGGWPLSKARRAQLADPNVIPSSLRTEDQDYYYTYYSTLIPSPASPPSRPPDIVTSNIPASKRSSSRYLDRNGKSDPDSQQSSPVEFYSPTRIQAQHPYAYSSSLPPQPQDLTTTFEPLPSKRETSQQHRQQVTVSDADLLRTPFSLRSPEPGTCTQREESELQRGTPLTPLRASMSVPNLSSTAGPTSRPVVGTKAAASVTKCKHRWLTAETWCDALLFPRPRFKVEQEPSKYASSSQRVVSSPITPVEGHVTWNSSSPPRVTLTGRPRAASATVNGPRVRRVLTKSRSTADLLWGATNSVQSHVGVGSTLEPKVDERPLTQSVVEQDPFGRSELSSVTPPPSLTQVLEEGETLARQREQWRSQATKSLGNRHARSMSRARSKSLSEKQARVLRKTDHSKGESNFDFLVTRTLLGSQSVTPTVHVAKRRTTSLHSKSYSHSHSHSRQTNLSCTQSHGHSQSHSMSTSHSSRSSRNPHLGHSRSESWGKAALLKAGSLCGNNSKDSRTTPVDTHAISSRPDTSIVLDLRGHVEDGGLDGGTVDRKGISPSPSVPSREGVGIAICSPLPCDQDSEGLSIPSRPYTHTPSHPKDQEIPVDTEDEMCRTSKYTHKSSDYAGPHPSTFDPNLSPPTTTSDVSLRHRLPPRAAVHVPHPYAAASVQSGEQAVRPADARSSLRAATSGLFAERDFDPHISISNADFERYGVGEALVYASLPKPDEVIRANEDVDKNNPRVNPAISSLEDEEMQPSPADEDNARELSPSPPVAKWTSVFQKVGRSHSSQEDVMSQQSTSSAHMIMASFGSVDDLEEFKDLFYRPPALSSSGSQQNDSSLAGTGIPSDVQSSRSSGSALTNLVRTLSDEITELKNSSRVLSDTISDHGSDSRIYRTLSETNSNQATLDSAILSSSPSVTEILATSPVEREGRQAAAATQVPEDVVSSSESLALEAFPSDENDTFGYPIRRGPVEAVPPSPIQTPRHTSTHPSILEGLELAEEPTELPSPTARSPRSNPTRSEVARSSYMTTTSDNSRMSGLSDFPLPPTTHPDIIRTWASFEATPLSSKPHTDARPSEPSSVPRATNQAIGYESHRMTFGGNEEMEIGIKLHRSTP